MKSLARHARCKGWAQRAPVMTLVPVTGPRDRDVQLLARLPQRDVGDSVLASDITHRRGPNAIEELDPSIDLLHVP